jgi:hypothetical protein
LTDHQAVSGSEFATKRSDGVVDWCFGGGRRSWSNLAGWSCVNVSHWNPVVRVARIGRRVLVEWIGPVGVHATAVTHV